jgi:hypothetical protein
MCGLEGRGRECVEAEEELVSVVWAGAEVSQRREKIGDKTYSRGRWFACFDIILQDITILLAKSLRA